MLRKVLISIFSILFLFMSFSFGLKRLTFEDFYSIKRIKNFDISKDGNFILFTVKIPDIQNNRYKFKILKLDLNSGSISSFLNSKGNDFNPKFSPDGKYVAFLSDRDGSVQIYVLNLNSGAQLKITNFPTGVDSFIWGGDETIYFSSTVYKGYDSVDSLKKHLDELKNRKTTAKILTSLMFRHWNSWINDRISHVFRVNLKSKKVDLIVGENYWCPPIDLGSSHDFVISPDGKELAFVSSPIKNKAISTNNDVYIKNLKDGTTENLTKNNPACDLGPLYSPDGRFLAYLSMKRPNFESDKRDIVIFDRNSGKFRNLTSDFPNTISDFIWGDEKTIFFTCPEEARRPIYKLNVEDGKIEYIFPSHFNRGLKYFRNSLYFMSESISHPIDIYKIGLNDKKLVQLTHVNDKLLKRLKLSPLHEFYFKGARGDKVHAIYIYPPFFKKGKKYPVVFLIHGGPQGDFADEFHYRWNAQMFASPGFIVVMINFHGSVGYGQKFTDSVSKNWGGAPYEDIIKGVKYFLNHHPEADEKRIGAAGASFGGFMIDWIEGHTSIFKCLVSHDGVFDQRSMYGATEELWFPEWEFGGTPWDRGNFYEIYSPSVYVNNFKTPMLVIHSQKDFRVPVTQGFQLFTALQRKGVPSEMLYFSDEDHFVQKPQNAKVWWHEVLGWLKKYLKKK